MEEAKAAAAYYDELTRKGEGAARFKQGLGFSSSKSSTNQVRGSALPSSSSFLNSFVRASSPGKSETETQKQIQLENVQNKLKKKQNSESHSRKVLDNKRESSRERERCSRKRSISRERNSERRYRSSSRERKPERRRRSRSRSYSNEERRRYRSSSRDRADDRSRDRTDDRGRKIERRRRSRSRSNSSDVVRRHGRNSRENRSSRRRRSRSSSPRERKSERGGIVEHKRKREGRNDKEKNGGIDYSRLITGYTEMTPGERVKAKMKLQLSQTVQNDTAMGKGAGWERFEFNKDAPLEEEEMEVGEDDAVLVKNIDRSFRFSAVEARREEQIKAAHDEAIFGAPVAQKSSPTSEEPILEEDIEESKGNGQNVTLISEKVLAKQTGSWRDRARKLKDG